MKAKRKRPTKADLILADPKVAAILAMQKQAARQQDIAILTRLAGRMEGRKPKPVAPSLRRPGLTFLRDPATVAHRYLRRFAPGAWHRGGHHVARLFHGPGIAIPEPRKGHPLQPYLINHA